MLLGWMSDYFFSEALVLEAGAAGADAAGAGVEVEEEELSALVLESDLEPGLESDFDSDLESEEESEDFPLLLESPEEAGLALP